MPGRKVHPGEPEGRGFPRRSGGPSVNTAALRPVKVKPARLHPDPTPPCETDEPARKRLTHPLRVPTVPAFGIYGQLNTSIVMRLLWPGCRLDRERAERVVELFFAGAEAKQRRRT